MGIISRLKKVRLFTYSGIPQYLTGSGLSHGLHITFFILYVFQCVRDHLQIGNFYTDRLTGSQSELKQGSKGIRQWSIN